jgi:peptide/nickel transport system substrate-binding protein
MLRRLLLVAIALMVSGSLVTAEVKTLRMAYDADPTSLYPHEQLASATLQLSHLTFDPLLRFRKDLTLQPRLATSWEKIDERTTLMMIGWQSDTQDSANLYEFLVMTPDSKAGYGQYNTSNYSNPEVAG